MRIERVVSLIGAAVGVLLLAAATAAAAAECPTGTVAHWPFEGTPDEAVNGFPGTEVGNVTYVPGVVGQAVELDGAQSYIDAGMHPELSAFGGSELSFAAWIYPVEDPQVENPAPPEVWNDEFSAVLTARTFCNEGNWQFYDRLATTLYASKWYQGDESFFFSSIELPQETWSHVAVAIDDGVARFYLDGVFQEETSDDLIEPMNAITQSVQVGWDSCGSYFTGRLDELSVFSMALSDEQVTELYETGVLGVSQCVEDEDGDGVPDDEDVCPGTAGVPLADGCDCDQILAFQPGDGGSCNDGTLNVFNRRIGWARGVPRP